MIDKIRIITECIVEHLNEINGCYVYSSSFDSKHAFNISGIYKKKPIAIKVIEQTRNISTNHKIYHKRFNDNGGLALIARNVEDIINELNLKRVQT